MFSPTRLLRKADLFSGSGRQRVPCLFGLSVRPNESRNSSVYPRQLSFYSVTFLFQLLNYSGQISH